MNFRYCSAAHDCFFEGGLLLGKRKENVKDLSEKVVGAQRQNLKDLQQAWSAIVQGHVKKTQECLAHWKKNIKK